MILVAKLTGFLSITTTPVNLLLALDNTKEHRVLQISQSQRLLLSSNLFRTSDILRSIFVLSMVLRRDTVSKLILYSIYTERNSNLQIIHIVLFGISSIF